MHYLSISIDIVCQSLIQISTQTRIIIQKVSRTFEYPISKNILTYIPDILWITIWCILFFSFCQEKSSLNFPKRKRRLKGREESPYESKGELQIRDSNEWGGNWSIGGRVVRSGRGASRRYEGSVTHVTVSTHFFGESSQYTSMAVVTPSSSLPFPTLVSLFEPPLLD